MKAGNGNGAVRKLSGKRNKPYQALAGFAKTKELAPGEEETLTLRFDLKEFASDERIRHLLYYVYGNGLESIDAFTVSMTVFLAKGKDVFGAQKLCASLGGDTDTVGALTGALCAAYAGGHNIPEDILATVIERNHLDIDEVARNIETTFWQ